MIIALLTIGLIFGTAFLVKNAKSKKSIKDYVFVLFGGVITFLFEPLVIVLFTDKSTDGGAIQMASTIFGIYCIGWSIIRIIKHKKNQSIIQDIIYCSKCGVKNDKNAKFCTNCGFNLI